MDELVGSLETQSVYTTIDNPFAQGLWPSMKNSYEEMLKDCNKQLSFVKVEFERDLDTLHEWMHEDHVIPYWNLNFTKKFAVHLKKALADTHQTLYLGCLDSIPMSYWESYWVKGDIIEDYYESEEEIKAFIYSLVIRII